MKSPDDPRDARAALLVTTDAQYCPMRRAVLAARAACTSGLDRRRAELGPSGRRGSRVVNNFRRDRQSQRPIVRLEDEGC